MQKKHWTIATVVAALAAAGIVGFTTRNTSQPTPNPIQSPAPAPLSTSCDPALWNFVYHPNRLPSKTDCRSVTGIVQWDKIEPDGDYHIRLQLDDPNAAPVNGKNIGGYLVVEPICQQTPTQSDAIGPCQGYNGPHFPLPSVGAHIQVSGYYTLDAQHGWMELHTVDHLDVIQ